VDDFAVSAVGDQAEFMWRGIAAVIAGDSDIQASAEDGRPEVPQELAVSVYPNPFNSATTIELSIPLTSSPLELTLYNTLGQVAYHETLRPTGPTIRHTLSAEGLASGVYVLACKEGEFRQNAKLVVMK
jgi:hypothetical protein